MTNELIIKLRAAFEDPVVDEKLVVFILSKTRKVLENENWENDYPLLKRHTDWCLHSKIHRVSPMQDLLENIEQTILSGNFAVDVMLDMIDFVEFKRQLTHLLHRLHIANKINQAIYWREFRKAFVSILIDCPLLPNLNEMTEFRFTRGTEEHDVNLEIKFKTHPVVNGNFNFGNY